MFSHKAAQIMVDRLIVLIGEYQAAMREAVGLFGQHKGLQPPTNQCEWMDRCRAGELPQRGFIDETATLPYFLHGFGCGVKLPAVGVDWDFGHEGRLDGFDAGRLWQFARWQLERFPEFEQKAAFASAFATAVRQSLMNQSYLEFHDQLYYLHDEQGTTAILMSTQVDKRRLRPSA